MDDKQINDIKIWPEQNMRVEHLITAFAKYNPRVALTPDMIEYKRIKNSIMRHGLVDHGIVYNKRTDTLVGGHQRVQILFDLGVKELPVVIIDVDLYTEKALNTALNSSELMGKWDKSALQLLIEDISEHANDKLVLTGFSETTIDRILAGQNADDLPTTDEDSHELDLDGEKHMTTCPHCGKMF